MLTTILVNALIIPPGGIIAALVVTLLYHKRLGQRLTLTCISLITILLWFISTPLGASIIEDPLLAHPPLDDGKLLQVKQAKQTKTDKDTPQAIIVLGGGLKPTPEYAEQAMPTPYTLERITYAANLAQKTGLPVMTVGGSDGQLAATTGVATTEAKVMAAFLMQYFHVQVRWQEDNSSNTYENAARAAIMLQQDDIKKVFLVTSASHMYRSVQVFTKQGIQVVPAPTGYPPRSSVTDWRDWLPQIRAFEQSVVSLHEWFGILWYRICGYI